MTKLDRKEHRFLAEIGASEQQQHAYRQLLDEPTGKELEICTPGAEPRSSPVSPGLASETSILQQQTAAHGAAIDIVEVISGREALQRGCELLQATVRRELRCLIPVVCFDPRQGTSLARGIRVRTVLDTVADCTQLQVTDTSRAEHRFAASLPFGLMLADRQLALLVLEHRGPQQAVLLVRPCALLEGLAATFELLWATALPLQSMAESLAVPDEFSEELEPLLRLLAAGSNDKVITHRLRISRRTLMRRVAKLLNVFQSRSRFQAGWAAALRLHGITAPSAACTSAKPARTATQDNSATNGVTYRALNDAPGVRLR